jgi:hypothetical protein
MCVLEPYGESLKTVQTFKDIYLYSGEARFESVQVPYFLSSGSKQIHGQNLE